MTWFKVDDSLAFHSKVVQAGNAAMGLWVRAGAYCGQHLTDGFISRQVALTMGKPAEIKRLVEATLWIEVDGGYRFHEWEERQPSREEVEKQREAEAKRKAEWRAKKAAQREAQRNGESGECPTGTTASVPPSVPDVSQTSPALPDPTRPDPVSPKGDTPSLRSGNAQKRARRIPDDFEPDAGLRQWAQQRGFNDGQIDELTEQFTRYWRAKSGRDATKLDWPATWQNWVAKEDPQRVRGAVRVLNANGRPAYATTHRADGQIPHWER